MELGEKLKALRTERGLTQEQLAAKLYVSRTAVSKWETGGGAPSAPSDGVRFRERRLPCAGRGVLHVARPDERERVLRRMGAIQMVRAQPEVSSPMRSAIVWMADGGTSARLPSPAPASPPRRGPRARMRALRTLPCTFLGI